MATASSTFTGTENPLSESGVWDSGPGSTVHVQKGVTAGEAEAADQTTLAAASYASSAVAFASDQESTVTWSLAEWAPQVLRGGPIVRMQGTGANQGDCYGFFGDDAVPNIRLYRIDDTGTIAYVQLGSSVAETIAVTDTTKVQAVGSTIKGFRNGVEKISQTDSTYTGGQPGFAIKEGTYPNAGIRFTDWQGDDVAGGGRTTKNTRAWPLGVEIGMNWRVEV